LFAVEERLDLSNPGESIGSLETSHSFASVRSDRGFGLELQNQIEDVSEFLNPYGQAARTY
jgi:hypothetical protein